MEQFHEDTTPFWLQTTNNSRHNHRHRRQSSSLLFNTGILIILLLAIAFAFIFIIIPSFQSFTSRVFKPQSLKKSWDSINLVLVLFAVICAFLSKNNGDYNDDNNNNNETSNSYENYKFSSTPKHGVDDHVRTLNRSSSGRWFYDRSSSIDRTAYNSLRRMRSSSSYPDLRQESTWVMNGGDERLRFNDDSGLYDFRSRSRRERDEEQVYLNSLKDIAVDTVSPPSPPPFPAPTQSSHPQSPQQFHPPSPPPSLPPQQPVTVTEPAPSPPPQSSNLATPVIVSSQPQTHPQLNPQPQFNTITRRKPKRIYEDVQRKEVESSELKMKHSFSSSPPPVSSSASPSVSSPPPLPPPPIDGSEKRGRKTKKKKGGATKDFLISLTRKKKHQRQRSVENLDEFFNLATLPLYPPPSPPPPPPPPPLPSFYNIFSSKKSKTRKQHSIPPPPPPPPSLVARASKRESNKPPVTIHKPPLPVKIRNVNNIEENVESGNDSPFRTIPPPPPPPPFKMPPWKFEVHGDYVRLKSINSSRSGSPDSDDPLSNEASPSDGNHGRESTAAGPLFCPSPDVNTKADNFIARFRAGLNLEKVNSVKGRSNLGLDPGPSTV